MFSAGASVPIRHLLIQKTFHSNALRLCFLKVGYVLSSFQTKYDAISEFLQRDRTVANGLSKLRRKFCPEGGVLTLRMRTSLPATAVGAVA